MSFVTLSMVTGVHVLLSENSPCVMAVQPGVRTIGTEFRILVSGSLTCLQCLTL